MKTAKAKPEPRVMFWRRVSAGGEVYGKQSKVHLGIAYQSPKIVFDHDSKRFVATGEVEDRWITLCGVADICFGKYGVYGGDAVKAFWPDMDDLPPGNLCRACFPPAPPLSPQAVLFSEEEEQKIR